MEGVSRAAGSGVPIDWNGRKVILQPLRLRHFGEIEQAILKDRPDPIEVANRIRAEMDPLPESVLETLVAQTYRDAKAANHVPWDEFMAYFHSLKGLAMTMWIALKQNQPDITYEEVLDILQDLPPEKQDEYGKAVLQASGLDERGNSTGPSRKTAGRAEPQGNEQSTGGSTSAS